MLLYCDRVVSTAFVGEVIAQDHALLAIDDTDTSDHVS